MKGSVRLEWVVCTTVLIMMVSASAECIDSERIALLKFKKSIISDPALLLSSWTSGDGKDCCRWNGVRCDPRTSHVVLLDLRPVIKYEAEGFESWYPLSGEISSSLLELPYLSHLDLSHNSFVKIPYFLGSLSELTYLNLSSIMFSGTFPYQLGNLSKLQYLDLSWNSDMTADNTEWLDRMSSLRVLNLSFVYFGKVVNWLKSIKMHPALSTLLLIRCEFDEPDPSSISHVASSKSLANLHLLYSSFNTSFQSWLPNVSSVIVNLEIHDDQLKGPVPSFLGEMKSLVQLDLSYNQLEGAIPPSFRNLCCLKTLGLSGNNLSGPLPEMLQNPGCAKNSLEILQLSGNKLTGSIPDITEFNSLRELYLGQNHLDGLLSTSCKQQSNLRILNVEENKLIGKLPGFPKFSSLTELYLAKNNLSGNFGDSIRELSGLRILDASSNKFNEVLTEVHFSNISGLQQLDLSYNSLFFNFSSDWTPPFQLNKLKLRSCKLGPKFPKWIRSQRNLSYLDISSSEISGITPSWVWNFPSNLRYLNLSYNHLHGMVPNLSVEFYNYPAVDLSSNFFYGTIPRFLSHTAALDLSKNAFTGSLSFLSTANDSGMTYLDLSDNRLSGGLPDCWAQLTLLTTVNLENNNLSGSIPSSMGLLSCIRTLHLRNNSITGEIPSSLKNCSGLQLLDLGENKLTGKVAAWIGENLLRLVVLRLRSNEFYGNLPSTLCHLRHLQILDLSVNNLSGTIPSCLNNLTALTQSQNSTATIIHEYFYGYSFWHGSRDWGTEYNDEYIDSTVVVWRGIEQSYGKTLGLLKLIDLSSNNMTGEIPEQVTALLGMISLNLSRNNLTGTIPGRIGNLKLMESLDLSHNKLYGEIPTCLAKISFLCTLDLSSNQLTGRIPLSTQLQSFDAAAYQGNPMLCGPPLNGCPGDITIQHPSAPSGMGNGLKESEEWIDRSSLYQGMGVGFAVGLWGIIGYLLASNCQGCAQFKFLKIT